MDSVGGIQVGDRVLLRHCSVEYAALLKKHETFPPLRSFRGLEMVPEKNALRVDARGVGIQPVVKVTACTRALGNCWLFDDSSPAAGRFKTPATILAGACGNPYEVGGQINQPNLTQILEARPEKGKWKYVTLWCGYDTPTLEPEENFYGCDA
eukprot:3958401-Pleurochrysis_carterae.AAC.1